MQLASLLAFGVTVAAADVAVVWHFTKDGPATSLRVHDTASDDILAQSCSSVLKADEVIDFTEIDNMGFGNFTVGDKQFVASARPEVSGGPICVKMYNDDEAIVECSGIEWDASSAATDDDCDSKRAVPRASVLPSRPGQMLAAAGLEESPAESSVEEPANEQKLADRQIICTSGDQSVKVGNGNPHQNYLHKQISENAYCRDAPSCSVGYEKTTSLTIGFSADISAYGWTSAGFAVQKSWSTGNQYTCYGGSNDEICIWYNTAHTAYTVKNQHYNSCTGTSDRSDPFVMYSPNNNNVGGGYYCVNGPCRNINAGYWDYSGRAGGP